MCDVCVGGFIIIIVVREAIQFKVQNEIHKWFLSSIIQPELPNLIQLEPVYLCMLCIYCVSVKYVCMDAYIHSLDFI